MTVFEYGNDMVLVDAGLMCSQMTNAYFARLHLYVKNEDKLRGGLITHGHEDRIASSFPYSAYGSTRGQPSIPAKLSLSFYWKASLLTTRLGTKL